MILGLAYFANPTYNLLLVMVIHGDLAECPDLVYFYCGTEWSELGSTASAALLANSKFYVATSVSLCHSFVENACVCMGPTSFDAATFLVNIIA